MLFFWKLVNTTSYKSVATVTVPRPINNLLNKSVKAHAVCKFLTNVSVNPIKPVTRETISPASKHSFFLKLLPTHLSNL